MHIGLFSNCTDLTKQYDEYSFLQCLQLVAFLFATCTMVVVVSAVEFDQRQPSLYGNEYYYYGGHTAAAADSENEEESQRTHHVKHKLKKLKKRLLLQCLLGHSRRRRDTSAASGRFLLPIDQTAI